MKLSSLASLAIFAGTAFAHGGIYYYNIEGTKYTGYRWFDPPQGQNTLMQRQWYFWPVEDPLSSNMTCNYNGAALPNSYHAPIKAGGVISAHWDNDYPFDKKGQPFYCDPADANKTCPSGFTCDYSCLYHHWYHGHGPMMAYLADCGGDCSVADPSTLKWFKIAEEGLKPNHSISDGDGWYQGDVCGNGTTRPGWDVTIPKNLKPGNYIIRHEILMIELMPPQFYPECAQLTVTGNGDSVPGEEYLVKFPGAYQMTDPGIAVSGSIYYPEGRAVRNYTVPGPKVWTG